MIFYREKFRALKKARKITSTKLAELLGTTRQTIYAWENGLYSPKWSDILLISEILNIPAEEISDITPNKSYKKIEALKKERLLLTDEKEIKELLDSKTLSDKNATAIINLTSRLSEYKNTFKRQKALINSYEKILSSIEQIVYVKDRNHRYKYVNEAFLSITGTEIFKDNITNIYYTKIFEKTDYYELLKLEKEVFRTGTVINNNRITIPNTAGRQIGLVNITPKYDQNGKIIEEIVVTIKDITKLCYTMEKQEQLIDAVNSLAECVFIRSTLSSKNKYIFLSSTAERIYGYPIENFYEDSDLWYKLIINEDKTKLNFNNATGFLNPGEWTYRIQRKDGKIRWIQNNVYRKSGINNEKIIFGKIADITESYKVQKAREELEKAVELSNTVVWVGDTNLRKSQDSPLPLTFISNNIYQHLGISKHDFLTESTIWLNAVYEPDYEKMLKFRKAKKFPRSIDFRIITKENNIKWVNLKIDRKDNLVFGVIRDFTESKKEEQLRLELHEAINNSGSLILIAHLSKSNYQAKNSYQYVYIGDKLNNYWNNITREELFHNHNAWHKCILPEDRQRVIESYNTDNYEIFNKYRVKMQNGSIKEVFHRTIRKGNTVYSYINFII